nr:MAG TPA: hypothetical protein [Caudoviricetes sp.]
MCPHIAPSGRIRSPAHQEKKGEKKKNGRCRVCPCISHDKVRFFNFSTFKWNFQKLFFGNIYHTGIVRPAHQIVYRHPKFIRYAFQRIHRRLRRPQLIPAYGVRIQPAALRQHIPLQSLSLPQLSQPFREFAHVSTSSGKNVSRTPPHSATMYRPFGCTYTTVPLRIGNFFSSHPLPGNKSGSVINLARTVSPLCIAAVLSLASAAKSVRFFYRFEYTIPALPIGEGVLRVSAVIAYGSICPLIPFGVFALLTAYHRGNVSGGNAVKVLRQIVIGVCVDSAFPAKLFKRFLAFFRSLTDISDCRLAAYVFSYCLPPPFSLRRNRSRQACGSATPLDVRFRPSRFSGIRPGRSACSPYTAPPLPRQRRVASPTSAPLFQNTGQLPLKPPCLLLHAKLTDTPLDQCIQPLLALHSHLAFNLGVQNS